MTPACTPRPFASLSMAGHVIACTLTAVCLACADADAGGMKTIQIETNEGTGLAFDLSPDGRTIVFDLLGQLWTLPAEGGVAVPITDAVADTAEDLDPVFSPDGRSVVFRADRPGGSGLFQVSLDDGSVRRLTPVALSRPVTPAWSPDGSRLAFNRFQSLMVIDLEGGDPREVVIEGLPRPGASQPAWSPDGMRLAFVNTGVFLGQGGRARPGSIWVVPAAGGAAQLLGDEGLEGRAPAWAPDGERLAFFAPDSSNGVQLWIRPRDGAPIPITSHADVTPLRVRWFPDGDRLLYHADGRLWTVSSEGGSPTEIPFSARLRFERETPVRAALRFPGPGAEHAVRGFTGLSISPDGNRIAMIALDRLWVFEVGGTPRGVAELPSTASDLVWSPDGDEVVWASGVPGASDLYVTDVSSGRTRRLTALEGSESHPSWSPDGAAIAFNHSTGPFFAGGEIRIRLVSPDGPLVTSTDAVTDVAGGFVASARSRTGDSPITWDPASGRTLLYAGFGGRFVLASLTGEVRPIELPAGRTPAFVWWTDGETVTYVEGGRLWEARLDVEAATIHDPVAIGTDPALYPSLARDGSILYVSGDGLRIRRPMGNIEILGWPLTYVRDSPPTLLIREVRIVSSETPEPVDILIESGRIARIATAHSVALPTGARVVDAGGRFVVPGLVDLHQHTDGLGTLQGALYHGVTTIRDASSGAGVAWLAAQRDAIESGIRAGPRIVLGGVQIHGSGTYTGAGVLRTEDQAARARALSLLGAFGTAYLKMRWDGDWPEMAELIRGAKASGWSTSGHSVSALPLIAAGVDGKEHAGEVGGGDRSDGMVPYDDIIQLYRAADLWVVPTLAFHAGPLATLDDPGRLDRADIDPFLTLSSRASVQFRIEDPGGSLRRENAATRRAVRTLHEAGVTIASGTDAFPWDMQIELEELVASGLTPLEALEAATRTAAVALGASEEIGTIEVGKWADLVILDADPLADISNTRLIWRVIKGGVEVDREGLLTWASRAGSTGP